MSRAKTEYTLTFDIGATKLAAALFDTSCNLIGQSRTLTHADAGAEAVLARLVRLGESLLKRCAIDERALSRIGVGCVGPLDSETGVIYSPPNLLVWDAFPLKERMEAKFGVPVFVDNDGNAAAMGEQRFGAGRGYRNIFYMTISTGIGSGLILDGKIYKGADYSAGEFGHIVLARNGPKCNCGGRGCLEALGSGTAIAKRAQREARRAPNSPLGRKLSDNHGTLTAKDVVAVARQGDLRARNIVYDAAVYIGLGITSAIHLLNPDIVIVGGGLVRAGKLLLDTVRQTVAERAQKHLAGHVPIVPAKLGSKAVVYGALVDALDRHSQSGHHCTGKQHHDFTH